MMGPVEVCLDPQTVSLGLLGTSCSVWGQGRGSVSVGKEEKGLLGISEAGCPSDLRDEVVHPSSQKVIIALLIASVPWGRL